MCTAYRVGKKEPSLKQKEWDIETLLRLMEEAFRIVRPTHQAPVLLPDGTARIMTWGFRRKIPAVQTKQRLQTIVNSREDKLGGRTWNKAFRERRCLIPAAGFYEWVARGKGNVPLLFERPGGEMIWIAGIWEQDQERGVECYSMITTEPNTMVGPVHDRMPAVLTADQVAPFLSGEINEFGPSAVDLVFAEAENFLAKKKASEGPPLPEPPVQGQLL